jgi:hypothetical protein
VTRWIAVLALAGPAFAAGDLGRLTGNVADSSGLALVDAFLAAVHEDTGIRRSVRTDSSGQYAIAGLEPGLYKVTARKPGFQTVAQLNVEVAAGATARVDFILPVGSFRETVTVEAARRSGGRWSRRGSSRRRGGRSTRCHWTAAAS